MVGHFFGMRIFRTFTFAIIFLLTTAAAPKLAAQELPHFDWFTTEQGLADNNVYCVFEDSRGLIWVGTQYGLSLYLGNGFKNYQPESGDPHSLPEAIIMDIVEDKNGHLWLAAFGEGLFEFDPKTAVFKAFRHDPTDSTSISGANVCALQFDSEDILWVGTYDEGLNKFDPKTGRFQRFYLMKNPSGQEKFWYNTVFDILEDPGGRMLWLAANNRGIVRFDKLTGQCTSFSSTRPNTERNSVRKIEHGPEGLLWAATFSADMALVDKKSGLYQYFPMDAARWQAFSAFSNIAVDFVRKSPTEFWVATLDRGLAIFNTENRQYYTIPTVPIASVKQSVSGVFLDRNQRLWVMNDDNGLSLFDPTARPFHFTAIQQPDPNADVTTDLAFDPARKLLYATTNNDRGFYIFKKVGDGFVFDRAATGISAINHTYHAVACDSEKRVWVGGATLPWSGQRASQPAFLQYFPEKNTLEPVLKPELTAFQIQEHSIHDIFCEPTSGIIWIASDYNGLIRWDSRAGKAEIFRLPKKPCLMTALSIDPAGNVWFSTLENGLWALNPRSGQFRQMTTTAGFRFLSVAVAADSKIWALMDGFGVQVFDPNLPDEQIAKQLGLAEGLAARKCCKLATDPNRKMWVSTERGLCFWDEAAQRFKTYQQNDGLVSDYLYAQGLTVAPDGQVIVGQNNGINWFKTSKEFSQIPLPKIWLTGFQVHGKDFFPEKDLNFERSLSLAHDQNFLTIHFASLQFTDPDKNRFLFRLKGVDKDWNGGRQTFASYTDIKPGDYDFEVKTVDFRGVWSEILTLKISIRPPWWQTWWAILFYFLTLAGLGNWFWKTQLNRKLAEQESRRLREMDDLKTRLYANITHEFRTPITLMLSPAEQAIRNFDNLSKNELIQPLELIRKNGRRLLGLVNQILDLRRLESGKMTVQFVHGDAMHLLRFVAESFYSLAETKNIRLIFENGHEPVFMDYDREKFVQIFSNLISNSLKFTHAGGRVIIEAAQKNGHFFVEIKDSGIGIAPADLPQVFDRFFQAHQIAKPDVTGSGIGLSLTKELVELLDGKIEAESIVEVGSVFRVILPVRQTAAEADAVPDEIEMLHFSALPPTGFSEISENGQPKPLALVADDNPEMAGYIASCLRQKFEVRVAANGRLAWEMALERAPDLIVSDVVMPEMDGLELCELLKNDERVSHVPVILLTARSEIADRLEGIRRGADVYLAKPFNVEELVLHATGLVELRKKLRERYNFPPAKWQEIPAAAPAEEKATIQMEDAFFKKVIQHIETNHRDPKFNVEALAKKMNMAYPTLHRKISALADKTAVQFIQDARLRTAHNLLAHPNPGLNVSEIAFAAGFNDPGYFSRIFTREFGLNPSELLKD